MPSFHPRAFGFMPFLLLVGLLGSAPAALGASTDVTATSLKPPAAPLSVLGGSTASLGVRNASAVAARRLAVTVVLSRDKTRGRGDAVVGGATLPALRARASRTLGITLVVPGAVRPGAYWLVACVTAGPQAQATKGNDCRVSARKVTVRAATAAVVPRIVTADALAVSGVVGAAGGSVAAPGPGGGTVTLTVPAKALAFSTEIRIVPVVSLTPGPPGITPVVSVIVEPEGLLVPGATIELTPPAGLPARSLRGFVFGGEDEAIAAAPRLPGKGLRLDASILGGYGIGLATPGRGLRAVGRPCLQATAAADPCAAESLRKRADAIMAGFENGSESGIISGTEALLRFEQDAVIPAMRAAVRAGASGDDLAPIISLALSIERQAQLLGIESPVSILAEVSQALTDVAGHEIDECSARTQGPAGTQAAVLRLSRAIELLGGGGTAPLLARLQSDCLAKPYRLTYEMSVTEKWTTSPQPFGALSGATSIVDLEVLYPPLGGNGTPASGPQTFSAMSCDPGTVPNVVSCVVNSATGELEATVIGEVTKTTDTQRCGRTVKKAAYEVVLQLEQKTEQQQLTVTFQVPGGPPFPQAVATESAFHRALIQGTEGELRQVTLPDDGGSELLIGSTANFKGSMLAVDATGKATLKLR